MKIYIDISNYYTTRSHTGIQRVLREILFRLEKINKVDIYRIIIFDLDTQKFILINHYDFLNFLHDVKNYKFEDITNTIAMSDIKKNDVFFDIDGVWNNALKRPFLYKKLKEQNVKIFNFIYDLVPVLMPQYSHENTTRNFLSFLHAVYQYSNFVFFDSRSAEKDFLDIKDKIGNNRIISSKVVKLGSDIHLKHNIVSLNIQAIINSKYILFVGTLEPRKNQKLMLDVFEELSLTHGDINLVIVGREGWNNDELINRIKNHVLLNQSLFWLNDINDNDLSYLYKNAFLCVYLSKYEGFGLPIAESLSHGKITITSKNSSMYEVGKNFADYLIYNSYNELYELIELYLSDDNLYNRKQEYIISNYKPYSWDLTYSSVVDVLNSYAKHIPIVTPKSLQFVFISIDKNNLQGTIEAIDKYMNFVDSYIIVTRESMIEEIKSIQTSNIKHIIDEKMILGQYAEKFSKRDHQSKNWLLRASLLNLEILHDQFIMLDDDNRPLREIKIDHFINNGKYNAYYFYDLLDWNSFKTDYDYGQHAMKHILDKDGFELLSYSSHRPQIIDKKLFKEAVDYFFEVGLTQPIDEWSIYFNYAVSKYPYLFNKLVFDTMNWPGSPSDWPLKYYPKEYNFENYYSTVYENGVFKSDCLLHYKDKIALKEKQMSPYIKNRHLHEENKTLLHDYNMIHGILKFKFEVGEIIFSGLPYYLEAAKGSWLKIPLNYKTFKLVKSKVEIFYWIKNKIQHKTKIEVLEQSFESIVEFAVSCTNLPIGEYDLLIDVMLNDKALYGQNSPYLIKLKIN